MATDDKNPDDKKFDISDVLWRDPTNKWTPDWTDLRSVRMWLISVANSYDHAAQILEGGVLMLRAMAATIRKAMPPWPAQAPDAPEEKK